MNKTNLTRQKFNVEVVRIIVLLSFYKQTIEPQWAKSPKKTVWRSAFYSELKIQCHVVKIRSYRLQIFRSFIV